jgi:hypothetical protein
MLRRAFLRSLLLCAAMWHFLPGTFYSQETAEISRSYPLPCQPDSIAASADGSTVWIACEEKGNGSLKSDWVYRNWVYALDVTSGRIQKISTGHGFVNFLPSPHGVDAVMTRLGEMHSKHALLLSGAKIVKELPIDWPIAWNSEGTKLYFEAGSTSQGEAWDILGILHLNGMSIEKVQLTSAAEGIEVCAATGEIYQGDPELDREGNLSFEVRVYDSNGKFLRKPAGIPSGRFSANCRYMATDDSFHGPGPWEIFDVEAGKRLELFPDPDHSGSSWQSFVAWNPRTENLYLRTLETPVKGSATETNTVLQIADAATGKLVASRAESGEVVTWSSDGESVILAKDSKLTIVPLSALR